MYLPILGKLLILSRILSNFSIVACCFLSFSSFSSNLNDSSLVDRRRFDCDPNAVDVPPITDADILAQAGVNRNACNTQMAVVSHEGRTGVGEAVTQREAAVTLALPNTGKGQG